MDLWFGDSWTIGAELGDAGDIFDKTVFPDVKVGRDNPLKAFPHHVSAYRKTPYINFARGASSIEYCLDRLINFCTTRYDPRLEYTAFLCATAQNRGFGISDVLNRELHYFDHGNKTEYDICIYDSIVALSSFYSVCKIYNIQCHIVPIFCDLILPDQFSNLVLFSDALLTNTCLVEETFKIEFVEDAFNSLPNTGTDGKYEICTYLDWIHPNTIHPNIVGHRKLAYKLIELLENR